MSLPVSAEPTTELHIQRSVPPFLIKTYKLVEDPSINDLISWSSDGSSFVVWRPAEFARDLLPKYFKHNNFSSFVRQLNTYGFRKVAGDGWEFTNEYFKRGEKRLLKGITRRKGTTKTSFSGGAVPAVPLNQIKAGTVTTTATATTTSSRSNSGEVQVVSTSNSSGGCYCYGGISVKKDDVKVRWGVAEENEWLRKENARLAKELSQLRSMWDSVYKLVSSYARLGDEEDEGRERRLMKSEPLILG